MDDEPDEPRMIRRGLLVAAAYVGFAVALYFFVLWGWPWLKAAVPAKFWSVF